jgi:hypothetical protein
MPGVRLGYGKYKCLGHNLAIMEMGKVIFAVKSFELLDVIEWDWLTNVDSL